MTAPFKFSASEYEAMRQLWVGVANAVIESYRLKISAGKTGKKSVIIDGRRIVLSAPANEQAEACKYFHSEDFREICEMAGIAFQPETAIKWVNGEITTKQIRRAWQ